MGKFSNLANLWAAVILLLTYLIFVAVASAKYKKIDIDADYTVVGADVSTKRTNKISDIRPGKPVKRIVFQMLSEE